MNVLILNLMPTKVAQKPSSYASCQHALADQCRFPLWQVMSPRIQRQSIWRVLQDLWGYQDNYYDGLIVTGAPVEKMDFEEVDYWEELTQVFEWSKRHVFSTCTSVGELRLVSTVTGFKKVELCDKLSGIYDQTVVRPDSLLYERLWRSLPLLILAIGYSLKEVLKKQPSSDRARKWSWAFHHCQSRHARSIAFAIWRRSRYAGKRIPRCQGSLDPMF